MVTPGHKPKVTLEQHCIQSTLNTQSKSFGVLLQMHHQLFFNTYMSFLAALLVVISDQGLTNNSSNNIHFTKGKFQLSFFNSKKCFMMAVKFSGALERNDDQRSLKSYSYHLIPYLSLLHRVQNLMGMAGNGVAVML